MRPNAAEALKAAIRRSIPIVVALLVFGAIVMNVVKQVQGPRYAASSHVYHTNTDLASSLANINTSFVDPARKIQTALSLANSPEPYERAARRLGGTGSDLQSKTKVTGTRDTDVIAFTTTMRDPKQATRTVNAIADGYVSWRADIEGTAIRKAIDQLEQQVAANPKDAQLKNELERLKVLRTLSSGGAVVIERARSAAHVSPAPVRDTLLGASLGFVIALLLAGAREALNTRVRSESDVEDALQKPVLASIQTLPKQAGLVTIGRHESRWGDTYALLAANIMQLRGGTSPTVLAVTSAIASEGKTTTAANLAVAMAMRGQRVILADFDIRKPSVARMFRIPPGSAGIVQIVDGDAEVSSALWNVELNGARPMRLAQHPTITRSSGNGGPLGAPDGAGSLRVIPAGGAERGARIARSVQVPELLAELTADADVVILDTPPALATVEMAELSTNVDAVLVVVRHGRVTRRSLLALGRQSEGWQAEILGAVLSDSPNEEDDYYYYRT